MNFDLLLLKSNLRRKQLLLEINRWGSTESSRMVYHNISSVLLVWRLLSENDLISISVMHPALTPGAFRLSSFRERSIVHDHNSFTFAGGWNLNGSGTDTIESRHGWFDSMRSWNSTDDACIRTSILFLPVCDLVRERRKVSIDFVLFRAIQSKRSRRVPRNNQFSFCRQHLACLLETNQRETILFGVWRRNDIIVIIHRSSSKWFLNQREKC